MATFSRSEVTTTVIQYEVPVSESHGAVYGEVMKALTCATHQAQELGIDTSWDDWCSFHPGDESIIIRFEKPGI